MRTERVLQKCLSDALESMHASGNGGCCVRSKR